MCVLWLDVVGLLQKSKTGRQMQTENDCLRIANPGGAHTIWAGDLPRPEGEKRQSLLLFYSSVVGSDVGMAWHVARETESVAILQLCFPSPWRPLLTRAIAPPNTILQHALLNATVAHGT